MPKVRPPADLSLARDPSLCTRHVAGYTGGMAQATPQVLGLGELLWDDFPGGRQLGGAPANFAYHVQVQGVSAAPVSAVGKDVDGDALMDALASRGVDTRFVARVPKPTGVVDVTLSEGGKPTYEIRRDVAWDHIPATEGSMAAARGARAICFGTLAQRSPVSRETIRGLLSAAPAGCRKVFDVNLRGDFYDAETVRAGLEAATVLKLSDEEVEKVAELLGLPADETAFGDAVLERFDLELLVVTRGSEGSLLRTQTESDEHPVVEAEVVSTVGAGDSFNAGIVSGLLKGLSLRELHDFAARLAAFVVTQEGAMPEIPPELRLTS